MRDLAVTTCVSEGYEIAELEAVPGKSARLQVTNTKPVRILVDGAEVGWTPLDMAIAPGKHKVTFVVGDDKHAFVIELSAGATVQLRKDIE